MGGLRLEVMRLEAEDGRQRAVGTGEFETLEVRLGSAGGNATTQLQPV